MHAAVIIHPRGPLTVEVTVPAGMRVSHGGTGETCAPEFGLEDADANYPPDFQIIRLRIDQNSPFQFQGQFQAKKTAPPSLK